MGLRIALRLSFAFSFLFAMPLASAQDYFLGLQLRYENGGRNFYRECRLGIAIHDGGRRLVTRNCLTFVGKGEWEPTVERKLSEAEAQRIRALFLQAKLFEGSFAGRDNRIEDGTLITLHAMSDRKHAILVVSGNPTFGEGPRKELFELLEKYHRQLAPHGKKR